METGQAQPGEEEIEDLETPGIQGTSEEVSKRSVTTVGKKDTSPGTVVNLRREGSWNACKMGYKMQIIF